MRDYLVEYMPWLLSAVSVFMTIKAGDLHRKAWLIGLGNQVLWTVWIVASAKWGFVPLNVVLYVVYVRNHLKWKRMHEETELLDRMAEVGETLKINGMTIDMDAAERFRKGVSGL